jgi:hypothetical protein
MPAMEGPGPSGAWPTRPPEPAAGHDSVVAIEAEMAPAGSDSDR